MRCEKGKKDWVLEKELEFDSNVPAVQIPEFDEYEFFSDQKNKINKL